MEKKKNKWKLMILPSSLFLLAFGLYAGYSIWENGSGNLIMNSSRTSDQGKGQTVAVFQEGSDNTGYSSVGRFISDFHKKYNDTLGWGRIDKVDWEEQRKIAGEIISVISTVETENASLQSDFEMIANYSKTIQDGSKDKKVLLHLHRFFHDLDIEVNEYNKTNDYFNVTKYKG
jgi:hypothetical protein